MEPKKESFEMQGGGGIRQLRWIMTKEAPGSTNYAIQYVSIQNISLWAQWGLFPSLRLQP